MQISSLIRKQDYLLSTWHSSTCLSNNAFTSKNIKRRYRHRIESFASIDSQVHLSYNYMNHRRRSLRIYAFFKHACLKRDFIFVLLYIRVNVFDSNIILLFVLSQFAIFSSAPFFSFLFLFFFIDTPLKREFMTYIYITCDSHCSETRTNRDYVSSITLGYNIVLRRCLSIKSPNYYRYRWRCIPSLNREVYRAVD